MERTTGGYYKIGTSCEGLPQLHSRNHIAEDRCTLRTARIVNLNLEGKDLQDVTVPENVLMDTVIVEEKKIKIS